MAVKQSFTVIFLGYYSSLKYHFKVRTRMDKLKLQKKKFNESISEKKSNESQDDI